MTMRLCSNLVISTASYYASTLLLSTPNKWPNNVFALLRRLSTSSMKMAMVRLNSQSSLSWWLERPRISNRKNIFIGKRPFASSPLQENILKTQRSFKRSIQSWKECFRLTSSGSPLLIVVVWNNNLFFISLQLLKVTLNLVCQFYEGIDGPNHCNTAPNDIMYQVSLHQQWGRET